MYICIIVAKHTVKARSLCLRLLVAAHRRWRDGDSTHQDRQAFVTSALAAAAAVAVWYAFGMWLLHSAHVHTHNPLDLNPNHKS
jgi:hypothetical protein